MLLFSWYILCVWCMVMPSLMFQSLIQYWRFYYVLGVQALWVTASGTAWWWSDMAQWSLPSWMAPLRRPPCLAPTLSSMTHRDLFILVSFMCDSWRINTFRNDSVHSCCWCLVIYMTLQTWAPLIHLIFMYDLTNLSSFDTPDLYILSSAIAPAPGGFPDETPIKYGSEGHFQRPFTGCMRDLTIHLSSYPIKFSSLTQGQDLQPCSWGFVVVGNHSG